MGKRNLSIHEAAVKGKAAVVREYLRDGSVHPDILNAEGSTALFVTCRSGHLGIAKLLLKAGANPNIQCGEYKFTPLFAACLTRHFDLLRELVRAGGNLAVPNIDGQPLLHMVAQRSRRDAVKVIVDIGTDLDLLDSAGYSALWHAAKDMTYTGVEMVKILLEGGASSSIVFRDGQTALMKAMSLSNGPVAIALVDGGADVTHSYAGLTPLIVASTRGQADLVASLCKAGVDTEVCVDGVTFLIAAVRIGCVDVVRHLCDAGANLEAKTLCGETPLILAAAQGHAEIVRYLCEAGADREIYFQGRTPLMIAAGMGHVSAARCLIQAGANVLATGGDGMDSLWYATSKGKVSIVRLLLEAGASATKAVRGVSSLHLATMLGHTDVLRCLYQAGADASTLKNGCTPLLIVVLEVGEENPEMVTNLIDAGARLEVMNMKGRPPLAIAADRGFREVVRLLLNAGARVDGGIPKQQAIYCATRAGHVDIVRQLLNAGADPAIDGLPPTALHIAVHMNQLDVVRAMLVHGCFDTMLENWVMAPVTFLRDCLSYKEAERPNDPSAQKRMREVLARGPAYFARSWRWPVDSARKVSGRPALSGISKGGSPDKVNSVSGKTRPPIASTSWYRRGKGKDSSFDFVETACRYVERKVDKELTTIF